MTSDSTSTMPGDPASMLYPDFDIELSMTRRLLEIVPWDHAEWKPHAKSWSLQEMALHIVQLLSFANSIASSDVLHFDPATSRPPRASGTDELLMLFDRDAATLRTSVASLDWPRLNGTWQMKMGESVMLSGVRSLMLRHMGINHIVHHRAQLSLYLRLLDAKIPGCYGPSADR